MTRPKAPTPFADALDAWLASSGLRKRLDLASAVAEWPERVGPQIAGAVTRAVAVTPDGTLVVRVASHPWATELGLMTPRISGAPQWLAQWPRTAHSLDRRSTGSTLIALEREEAWPRT